MEVPEYTSPMPAVSVDEADLKFPVRVFELVGGVPTTEIPCIAPCPLSGSVFKFAIPGRATGGQPTRVFRVMTMIGPVSGLRPRDSVQPADPPFFDDEISSTHTTTGITTTARITGIVDRSVVPERTGCVKPGPGGSCQKQGTIVPYRALRYATLTFSGSTISEYFTAATAALAPEQAALDKGRPADPSNNWTTSEGLLP
jgi:hypothetical protein